MKTNNNGYGYLTRLKANQPFSNRLNAFIETRAAGLKYNAGNFPEMDFPDFKKLTEETGYMQISNENCEGTIFGNPEVNVMFRAWHDSIHIQLNEDFGYMAEARVAFAQCAELPNDWHFERQLILCEVIAQAAHHEKTGNFVADQRKFTIEVLTSGKI